MKNKIVAVLMAGIMSLTSAAAVEAGISLGPKVEDKGTRTEAQAPAETESGAAEQTEAQAPAETESGAAEQTDAEAPAETESAGAEQMDAQAPAETESGAAEQTEAQAPAEAESGEAQAEAPEAVIDLSRIDPEATEDMEVNLGIISDWQLRTEREMTLSEWDAAVESARQEALASPLTAEAILSADGSTQILEDEDGVYFIGESGAFDAIETPFDAYRLAYQLLPMLGGSEETELMLYNELVRNDMSVYSFNELDGATEVPYSSVKLAVNADGSVSAVFGSISTEEERVHDTTILAEALARAEAQKEGRTASREELDAAVAAALLEREEKVECITEEEAEAVVLETLKAEGEQAELIPEATDRIIFDPLNFADLTLDYQVPASPRQVMWVVYTTNPSAGAEDDCLYIAHYVTRDGSYDHAIPVGLDGDIEARSGYKHQQLFEGMVPDKWSGTIEDVNGIVRNVVLPVMRSEDGETWVLGDADRHIVVADYAEAAYGEGHPLVPVSSATNDDWDNADLIMYFNYIRSWDFYYNMGWNSPNGKAFDVAILKDLCTSSGTPFVNACSMGQVESWMMFGYTGYDEMGTPSGLSDALDVMAHEYTHSFTQTMMNSLLYENDYGAINESLSDIMGNLIEYAGRDTEDEDWLLGENTGRAIRSMTDPHNYDQPAYVWDIFYGPNADVPSAVNDEGGVHVNSSLLNRIFGLLITEHGMSIKEGVNFFTAIEFGLTPRADFPRLGVLLDWALNVSGNEKYAEALDNLIEETRLGEKEIPEVLPEGQKLVKLSLPKDGVFEDPSQWVLLSIQVNPDVTSAALAAFEQLAAHVKDNPENSEGYLNVLKELMSKLELDGSHLTLKSFENEEETKETVNSVLKTMLAKLVNQQTAWQAAGTDEVTAVMRDGMALHLLLSVVESGTKLNGLAVLIGDRWYDLGVMTRAMGGEEKMSKEEEKELMFKLIETGADIALHSAGSLISKGMKAIMGEDSVDTSGDQVVYLPTEGLENVRFIDAA